MINRLTRNIKSLFFITLVFEICSYSVNAADISNVIIGEEVSTNFTRVFVQDNKGKRFVSEENFNDFQADQEAEFLVWSREINGLGQIFRYHIPTGNTLQITYTSNNMHPKVDSKGRVAWLKWDGNGWQVHLFDGLRTSRISRKFTSDLPVFIDGHLIYSVRNEKGGDWTLQAYKLDTREYVAIPDNFNASSPELVNKTYFQITPINSTSILSSENYESPSLSIANQIDWVDSSDIEEEINDLVNESFVEQHSLEHEPESFQHVSASEENLMDSLVSDSTLESSSSTQSLAL